MSWLLLLGPLTAYVLFVVMIECAVRSGSNPDRLKVSQWFPWRWMFWRRVRCEKFENGKQCRHVASIKCVYGDFAAPESEWSGYNYARDPLCSGHGAVGPCPTQTMQSTYRGRRFEHRHIPIPRSQQWRRVHFRIRIGWEG
jgi:hypothetical protein